MSFALGGVNYPCYGGVCTFAVTKLHLTAQSGPAILVILCYSLWAYLVLIRRDSSRDTLCACLYLCRNIEPVYYSLIGAPETSWVKSNIERHMEY